MDSSNAFCEIFLNLELSSRTSKNCFFKSKLPSLNKKPFLLWVIKSWWFGISEAKTKHPFERASITDFGFPSYNEVDIKYLYSLSFFWRISFETEPFSTSLTSFFFAYSNNSFSSDPFPKIWISILLLEKFSINSKKFFWFSILPTDTIALSRLSSNG